MGRQCGRHCDGRGRQCLSFSMGLLCGAFLISVVLKGSSSWEQLQTVRLPRPPPGPTSLVVATGANAAYFRGLANLVGSVKFWCPECNLVVYNLGLDKQQLGNVTTWCGIDVRNGSSFTRLGNVRKYAWKPVAIKDAVDAYGSVLWLDAGSTVTGPLTRVFEALHRDGHFLVQGQDMDCSRWVHPGTFQYLRLNKTEFMGKPSFSGNTVGFVRDSPAYQVVLRPLVECARSPLCIAPSGSSLGNHRYDQSAMTALAYSAIMDGKLEVEPQTWVLAATRRQLNKCHEPSEYLIWTSRSSERCYVRDARSGC